MKRLIEIQNELKAPKNQYNDFGKYNYRSCEDILEGVKPLLQKHNLLLIVNDEIEAINTRFYVRAVATIYDAETGQKLIATSSLAREEENKKGMDASQVTGATSSYARKYALNGLFAIDDAKDADFTNKHGKDEPKAIPQPPKPKPLPPKPQPPKVTDEKIIETLSACSSVSDVEMIWKKYNAQVTDKEAFTTACKMRKETILKEQGEINNG